MATQARPLGDNALRIWRAIANAGRSGTTTRALADRFDGVIAEDPISHTLQSLIRGKYIAREGVNRYGTWRISLDTRVPFGEAAPEWLFERDDGDGGPWRNQHAESEAAPAPTGPSSVFALAASDAMRPPRKMADINLGTPPTEKQSKRSQQGKAAALRFTKATNERAPALGWQAPEGADKVPGTGCDGESPGCLVGGFAPHSASSSPDDDDFVTSLSSKGELYIKSGLSEMNIPLDHVRKFFRYLDGLFGTDSSELLRALS